MAVVRAVSEEAHLARRESRPNRGGSRIVTEPTVTVTAIYDIQTMDTRIGYRFERPMQGPKEAWIRVTGIEKHSLRDEGVQKLLVQRVRGIAAQADVDSVMLLKATVLKLIPPTRCFAGMPKQSQSWNGDVNAPPTDDEIKRAWRELGLME